MNLSSPRARALAAMALAVLIYGGQFGFVRQGLAAGLTPADIAALRYLAAGAIMAAIFLRMGLRNCAGLGWGRGLALVATGGLPLIIVSNVAMQWAPAAHAAALQPGTVALSGTLIGYIAAREAIPGRVVAGIAITLVGLLLVALAGAAGEAHPLAPLGYAIFVVCGLAWAGFTHFSARWKVEPIAATATVSVLSAAMIPLAWPLFEHRVFEVDWRLCATQAFYQGVLVVVVGMILWTYGARELGTRLAVRFPPMVPVFGALLAYPIAGEAPSALAWTGIAAIVAGLVFAAWRR